VHASDRKLGLTIGRGDIICGWWCLVGFMKESMAVFYCLKADQVHTAMGK